MASPTAGKAVMHTFKDGFTANVSCTAYGMLGRSSLYRAAPNSRGCSPFRLQPRLPPSLPLVNGHRAFPRSAVDVFHIARRSYQRGILCVAQR